MRIKETSLLYVNMDGQKKPLSLGCLRLKYYMLNVVFVRNNKNHEVCVVRKSIEWTET